MKVLIIQDEEGQYIGGDNKRYNLIICSWAEGPRASEFKEFDTLEDALEYYKLKDVNTPMKEEKEKVVISEIESTTEEVKPFELPNEGEENVSSGN